MALEAQNVYLAMDLVFATQIRAGRHIKGQTLGSAALHNNRLATRICNF